jgi:hypothetical protein
MAARGHADVIPARASSGDIPSPRPEEVIVLRRRSWSLPAVGAAVLAAAAVALPVAGQDGDARDPAAEDELPLSDAERRSALSHLREVAACARARGADVPDPVADGEGVHLSWTGPRRPHWEAALRSCDDALP